MAKKKRQIFSIPTEELRELLITDDLVTTPELIKRLDALGAWSGDYLADAEYERKAKAIGTFFQKYHEEEDSRDDRRSVINTVQTLKDGTKVRGWIKKEKASLEGLVFAEDSFRKQANTCYFEALDCRAVAKARFGAQIGLPFEFEAERRPVKKATRAARGQARTPGRRQPEKTK